MFNVLLYSLLTQTAGGLSHFFPLSSPQQECVVNSAYVSLLEILPPLPTPTHEMLMLLLSRTSPILDTMPFMFNGRSGRESCISVLDIYAVSILRMLRLLRFCPDTIL
ncbi:UNVERIFIED_CONTAM: hypothetical protein K2H54_059516 [Gekko kuhli]